MKPHKPLYLLLGSAIFLSGSAQANNYFDETDVLADIAMVNSGSRLQQKAHNSPSSVTVITSDMIAALAPNSLVEVFRLAPSFVSFYVNGSLPGVSGHDSTDDDPRRLEVRINGRSVYLPSYPTIAWESLGITPNDIDRIEMVRGSNVPAYGSNAIMGAINIITKSPLQEAGTHISSTIGDRDTRNFNVRHNFRFNGGYGQLRMANRENSGFEGFDAESCLSNGFPIDDCEEDPDYGPGDKDILDDGTKVNHMVFNAVLTPSLSNSYTLELGYSKGSFGLGDGDSPGEFRDDDNTSWWVTSSWNQTNHNDQWDAHLSFYESHSEQNVRLPLLTVEDDPDDFDDAVSAGVLTAAERTLLETTNPVLDWGLGQRKAQSLEAELQYQFKPFDGVRTLIGTGYKLQRLKSRRQLNKSGYVNNDILYLFSNTEWRLSERWLTNLGFMLEDHKLDEPNFSPRASLHFQINPQHVLRVSASKVYRSPSIIESEREQFLSAGPYVDYHLIGDDDLAAEEINELQLAYYGSFFDGKLLVDWRAFHEDMEGAIDHIKWEVDHQGWTPSQDFDGKGYFFSNAKDWQVSGYDIQVTIKPTYDTAIYVQHTNNRVDAWRQKDWYAPEGERRYHEVPEHVSSILATHRLNSGWTFAVMGYRQNFTNWRGGKDLDLYRRFDVSVSKRFSLNEYDLTLNAKVDNITDDEYEEYQDGNFFRRSVYLNATLQW